ncbi:hypothetical protein DB31_0740 [Hyalangium minutum]|uniref:Uncharacterized protein n=1 Tax=Hyalangium minutum TaxID=394096 RepID=A0A085WXR4_9BACT|nr:hypothetical protein DB31_0740 [Hyalangium minutum]
MCLHSQVHPDPIVAGSVEGMMGGCLLKEAFPALPDPRLRPVARRV